MSHHIALFNIDPKGFTDTQIKYLKNCAQCNATICVFTVCCFGKHSFKIQYPFFMSMLNKQARRFYTSILYFFAPTNVSMIQLYDDKIKH
jgi:hypothetical protein